MCYCWFLLLSPLKFSLYTLVLLHWVHVWKSYILIVLIFLSLCNFLTSFIWKNYSWQGVSLFPGCFPTCPCLSSTCFKISKWVPSPMDHMLFNLVFLHWFSYQVCCVGAVYKQVSISYSSIVFLDIFPIEPTVWVFYPLFFVQFSGPFLRDLFQIQLY